MMLTRKQSWRRLFHHKRISRGAEHDYLFSELSKLPPNIRSSSAPDLYVDFSTSPLTPRPPRASSANSSFSTESSGDRGTRPEQQKPRPCRHKKRVSWSSEIKIAVVPGRFDYQRLDIISVLWYSRYDRQRALQAFLSGEDEEQCRSLSPMKMFVSGPVEASPSLLFNQGAETQTIPASGDVQATISTFQRQSRNSNSSKDLLQFA